MSYIENNEYLFDGYNGQDNNSSSDFKYLEQGYYDLGDDVPALYDYEEQLLIEFYGEYYANGTFLQEGFTRESLLEDAYEYMCYNGYAYDYGYGYYGYYGFASQEDYEAYNNYLDEANNFGKSKPEHSIEKMVDIKKQNGPKCSAYAASCLLRYYGEKSEPDKLYKKFLKLPDGSAIPSSVGKVIKAKLKRNGKIEDLERLIEEGKPVLVLIFYDKQNYWDNLHYVLITGFDKDNVYIADSLHSSGERYYNRCVSRDVFCKMWDTSKTLPVKLIYGKNLYYEYNPPTN